MILLQISSVWLLCYLFHAQNASSTPRRRVIIRQCQVKFPVLGKIYLTWIGWKLRNCSLPLFWWPIFNAPSPAWSGMYCHACSRSIFCLKLCELVWRNHENIQSKKTSFKTNNFIIVSWSFFNRNQQVLLKSGSYTNGNRIDLCGCKWFE